MRLNSKLLRTSTFRLSALYLFIFALSVAAILGYVYLNTAVLLERQTDDTIRAEVQALADQYRFLGIRGVADTVRRRSDDDSRSVYLLESPAGAHLAGNLVSMPDVGDEKEPWIEFPFTVKTADAQESHRARAFSADLPEGYALLVGRDIEDLRQFGAIIRNTLIGALIIALVLGLGGGLLMSRNFLRRVDAITDASRTIMVGDLSGRMPVQGTGDELDRLAESLNAMLDQIERLMSGMKEVSSNVAHDLKTPLTRLKARAEAALRSGRQDDYKEALTGTIEESDRLLNTFNALLSIAKAEAGQSREGLQPLDAAQVVRDVVELYEPLVEEEGGTLTVDISAPLEVRASRQLLAQAISNLIDNAMKYGAADDRGAEIAVTGWTEGSDVVIAVTDKGPGVPEADRDHVIRRFVRLDASRTKPGNGLGLSLVNGVTKLHDGHLVLEDNAPGLRAKIILPRLTQTAA
ncbi:ATP-binding protein [soil metagenome]